MKRIFTLACMLFSIMSSFALTIEDGKVYTIANRNDNNLFVRDAGNDVIAMGANDANALWIMEDAGDGHFYVKNFTTGRYAQECSTSAEVSVTLGDTPVAYSIVDCSAQEGENCFGLTSTNESVTNFTAGCIGWNWKNDNTVQTFAAVAGTNHRSFWKITEAPTSVTLDKTEYKVGDPVVVTYINTPGGAKDWMAIYKAAQSPGDGGNSSTYRYVSGKSGKMTLNVEGAPNWEGAIGAGDYYVAYLLNDGYDEGLPRASFKVLPETTGTLTLDKDEYEVGEPIVVTYANTPGGATDWIAIYKSGETPGVGGSESATYRYVIGESGEMTLNVEDAPNWKGAIAAGDYYVTYLLNDGYSEGLDRVYFTVNTPAGHEHNYVNGICSCDGDAKYEEPALVDGYYLLDNAGKVEWFSHKVDLGGDANLQINGKLTADIDFTDITHMPIGQTTGKKYNGVFDGQGHRIMNMVINRPDDSNIGFFGFLRGNAKDTKVLNLIMDKTCSITAANRAGGIAGSCQNNGATITIENCINEASVTVSGQDAAGFVGGVEGNNPKWIIRNCVNAGTITSTHEFPYVGALFCYQGNGESVIENFINIGTINGHRGGNMGRMSGTIRNLVDLSDTNMEETVDGQNRGLDSGLTSEAIASGALAYYINKVAGSTAFYQTIGTDAYPVPFATSAVVYEHASYRCDGETLGTVTYDNTEATPEIPAHTAHNAQGVCPVCKKNYQEPAKDGDWYLAANAGNIEWLSDYIQKNGKSNTNIKLIADIDFEGITHTPIGQTDTYKFDAEFDGQGHHIQNLVLDLNQDNVGFFGWARGGGHTIKNLVIDNTCSFTGNARVGALIGCVQRAADILYIENVVNMADVVSRNGRAGGFIGGGAANNDHPRVMITNCANIGNVTVTKADPSNEEKAGAFFGWLNCQGNNGGNSTITNSYNFGDVTPVNGTAVLFNGSFRSFINAYELKNESNTQGTTWVDADMEGGELAYTINKNAGEEIFFQTIGTDSYPVPFSTSKSVYGIEVSDAGYATYMAKNNVDFDVLGVEEAYKVKSVESNYVVIEEVHQAVADDVVIVKRAEGADYFNAPDEATTVGDNCLKASATDIIADGSQYVLAKNDEGKVGFHKVFVGDNIAAGKGYIEAPAGAKMFLVFEDGETTAIEGVIVEKLDGTSEVYNLQGQKLSGVQRGINIVNGKKVLF